MPNHVTHRVRVHGPETAVNAFIVRCIVSRAKDGEDSQPPQLDFNSLIPRPACLDDTTSGSDPTCGLAILGLQSSPFFKMDGAEARERFDNYSDERREAVIKATLKSVEALLRTGFCDWYNWSRANWGTKWNAYSYETAHRSPGFIEFTFDTAWSPPTPFFEALGQAFPELMFEIDSFDESWHFACSGQIGPHGYVSYADAPADAEHYERTYGAAPAPIPD